MKFRMVEKENLVKVKDTLPFHIYKDPNFPRQNILIRGEMDSKFVFIRFSEGGRIFCLEEKDPEKELIPFSGKVNIELELEGQEGELIV